MSGSSKPLSTPPMLHVCVDRKATLTAANDRLAVSNKRKWDVRTLRVRFFDDVPQDIRGRIRAAVVPWVEALQDRLKIQFDDALNAEIRISTAGLGHWSWIGTEAREKPVGEATMNFQGFSAATDDVTLQRVVRHEFGHALGCLHEFMNPDGGVQWNEEAVYAYYGGPPNFWDRDKTKANVLKHYDKTVTSRTAFDPNSIMMYPVPAEFTTNGVGFEWKSDLSPSDKTFIRQIYST
jgi:hypothetical protein